MMLEHEENFRGGISPMLRSAEAWDNATVNLKFHVVKTTHVTNHLNIRIKLPGAGVMDVGGVCNY